MIQSLNAVTQISKALLGIRDAALIREKVIELSGEVISAQSGALAAQADQFALLERIRQLEKQIADFEAWDAEAETYQLTDLRGKSDPRGSILAYAPKEGTHTSEPAHFLCAKCYHERHKSILQHETRDPGRCKVLVCHRCGSDLYLEGERDAKHAGVFKIKRS